MQEELPGRHDFAEVSSSGKCPVLKRPRELALESRWSVASPNSRQCRSRVDGVEARPWIRAPVAARVHFVLADPPPFAALESRLGRPGRILPICDVRGAPRTMISSVSQP